MGFLGSWILELWGVGFYSLGISGLGCFRALGALGFMALGFRAVGLQGSLGLGP